MTTHRSAGVIELDRRIAAGIAEGEAVPDKEKNDDDTENRGENHDPQYMVTLHLCDSLKTYEHTREDDDVIQKIEI